MEDSKSTLSTQRHEALVRPSLGTLLVIVLVACAADVPAVAASLDGVVINEFRHAPELFNDRTNQTSTVNVFGNTLVFDADEPPESLIRRFSERIDVREMCLSAETVIIRSPFFLPQTHVTIYARELRFERNGRLETTPIRRRFRPPAAVWSDNRTAGRDGEPGHPGGDIEVFVQQIFSDATTSRRLVLQGGDGGPAGEGRNGLDDGQFPFLSEDWNRLMQRSGNALCGISELGSYVIYRVREVNGRVTSRCGTETSAFGESAVSSGIPGPGGRGGTLRSTVSIGQYADVRGGVPGARGGNYVGAALSDRAFVYEFVRTIVRNEREIATTEETAAPRERGRDAVAPAGIAGVSGTFLFLTNAEPRLSLSVNFASETATLSWPSFLTGFRIQQSTNLAATNWVDVQQPLVEMGSTRSITTRLSVRPHFYRLAKVPVQTAPFTNGVPR